MDKFIKLLSVVLLLSVSVFALPKFPPNPTTGEYVEVGGRRYQYGTGGQFDGVSNTGMVSSFDYSTAQTEAGLQTAITAIGSDSVTLLVDKPYVISNSLSIPVNITIKVTAGGSFAVANTKTLTINGDFDAGLYQVFSGLGSVSFTKKLSVVPQWWGAVGDGNDANADVNRTSIQKAIDSLTSGSVKIVGNFSIKPAISGDNYIVNPKSGVDIIGISENTSKIKIANSAGNYKAIFGKDSGLTGSASISGITFDHNAQNNGFATLPEYQLTPRATVIIFVPNFTFSNNIIENSDSVWHVTTGNITTQNVHVVDNKFLNMGYPLTDTTLEHDTSMLYLHAENIVVSGNIFTAVTSGISASTAIETHAITQVVSNNIVRGFMTGANITGIAKDDTENVTVENNVFDVLSSGISLWSADYSTHITGYGIDKANINNNMIRVRYTNNQSTLFDHSPKGITINPNSDLNVRNIIISKNNISFDYEDVVFGTQINSISIGIGIYGNNAITVDGFYIKDNIVENAPVSAIRLAGASLTVTNGEISRNTIINPGQTLTTDSNVYKSSIWLAAIDITGRFDIQENSLIDTAPITRIKYAYQLYNTAISGELNIVDNKIDLQGADISAWVRPLYQQNATQLPFYRESTIYTRKPIQNCKKSSELFDISNGIKYRLYADGTAWIQDTPPSDLLITAAGGVTVTSKIQRIAGNGGAIDITADPQIADGSDGQIVILQGVSDASTVKFDDGTGLQLAGGASITLGKNDMLQLLYDSGDDLWIEISRSDN